MENYFMNYNLATGEILGFYLKSMHGDNIPSPTIEITSEKHQFYIDNQGKYKLNLQTMEDELIPLPTPQQQLPSQEDRLAAAEAAIAILMGV